VPASAHPVRGAGDRPYPEYPLGTAAAIVLLAAILLFDRQFEDKGPTHQTAPGAFAATAVWLVIALTALNVVSTLLECGFGACADNPVVYELLKRGI
jgi:hypothetical protein